MFQLLNNRLSYYFFLISGIFFFAIKDFAQEPKALDTVRVISSEVDSTDEEAEEEFVYNPELVSQYRPVPKDTINAISKDKRFYYKNYLDSLLRASKKAVKVKKENTGFFQSLYEFLIWIGAITIVGFLIYRLFFSQSSLFLRNRAGWNVKIKTEENEIPADLNELLQQAINRSEYRLAIRYLYLKALKDLAGKGFLEISPSKTNFQYVSEVSRRHFANEFASLTLKYEYVWYGNYSVDENLFRQIQTDFNLFNKNSN